MGALLAAAAGALSGANPAVAGTYVMRVCGDSTARALGGAWAVTAPAVLGDECGAGGAISISDPTGAGLPAGGAYELRLAAPGGVSFVGADLAAGTSGAVNVGGEASQTMGFAILAEDRVLLEETRGHGQDWSRRGTSRIHLASIPAARSIALRVSCGVGPVGCGIYTTSRVLAGIDAATFTLREDTPPLIANISGVTTGRIYGQPEVSFDASDFNSGPRTARVLLGETVVASTAFAGCAFNRFTPCPPLRPGVRVAIDTTKVPDGLHELRVQVTDAAGNTTSRLAGSVEVDNLQPPVPTAVPVLGPTAPRVGEPVTLTQGSWSTQVETAYRIQRCNPAGEGCVSVAETATYTPTPADVGARLRGVVIARNPAGPGLASTALTDPIAAPAPVTVEQASTATPTPAAGGSLTARWARNKKARMTVAWAAGATITGRVRDAAGTPVVGAVVRVAALPRGEKTPTVLTATTNATGVWRAKVKGRTRSQTITATTDAAAAPIRLGLAVRARLKLTARATGRRLTITGRLAGRGAGGRVVELQVRVPGRNGWVAFRTVRTRAHGRFTLTRRVIGAPAGTVYQFRARLLPQQGFGYHAGTSPIRTVQIR